MQIEIDFDVYKTLTARRLHERHSYNDVLRELLDLGPAIHPDSFVGTMSQVADRLSTVFIAPPSAAGFSTRNLLLPNGTQLRATYKGRLYQAVIQDGAWLDELGKEQTSPSGAAHQITGTNVNGWRFWEAMRPADTEWRRLDMLI